MKTKDKWRLLPEAQRKELEQLELSARLACDQYGKTDQSTLQPIPHELVVFLQVLATSQSSRATN
jgi:hypothetical protein